MTKTIFQKNLSGVFPKVLFLLAVLSGLSHTSYGTNENLNLSLSVISSSSRNLNLEDTLQFSYPKDTIDLGIVTEGEVVEFAFTIRNNYDTAVQINQIHPSCGCTTTDTKGFTLNAGESREIKLSFHSEGRVGSNERTVHVFTDKGLFGVHFYVIVAERK